MQKILIALLMMSASLLAKDITVSIVPQKYFVEKIAKDKINVNVMVKPGFSPATYEPKTSQMRKLAKSDAYLSIGVPFEKVWLEKFRNANKKMLMVDTSLGIKKLQMEAHVHHDEEHHDEHKEEKHEEHGHHDHDKHEKHHDHDEHEKHHDHDEHEKHHDHDEHKHDKHDHGHHDHDKHDEHKHHDHAKHEKHAHHDEHKHDKHEHHDEHKEDKHDDHHGHDHSGPDPHVWLDPMLVKVQAKNIYDALVKVDAANKAYYLANYKNFVKELEALNKEIASIVEPYEH